MLNRIKLRQKGMALVTTLALVTILSFTLLSYISLVSWQRMRAKSFFKKAELQSLNEMAAQEAIAKIMSGCELYDPKNGVGQWQWIETKAQASAHVTACPGLMSVKYYDLPEGSDNPRLIPLFSYRLPSAASDLFNINTVHNPFYRGEFYLTGYPDATNAEIFVQWIPVYQNPEKSAETNNPITGRYAYWVDVENSKINLKMASRPFPRGSKPPEAAHSDAAAFSWWLDWQNENNMRPRIADNSLVEWSSLTASISDDAMRARLENSLTNYLEGLDSGATKSFNFWPEIYSIWTPQSSQEDRKLMAMIRKTLETTTTLYGSDDERDPLGREKIDLLKFQREFVENNNPTAGYWWNEILKRLHDASYHRAYDCGNSSPKSFVQAMDDFWEKRVGSGEVIAKQILLNIGEYAKPLSLAPHREIEFGIIPQKPIPYVKEVCTRVRSALVTHPHYPNISVNDFFDNNNNLLPGASDYLTNVVVELKMFFKKPTLPENASWNGKIILNYRLEDQSATTTNCTIDQISQDYVRLGITAGNKIKNARGLQIDGWDIRSQEDVLFHRVPLPYPRKVNEARPWWTMAQQNANTGRIYNNELKDFSFEAYADGHVAIGWITKKKWNAKSDLGKGDIYLDTQLCNINRDTVGYLISTTKNNSSLVERVYCKSPSMGHRTGDFEINHFYGALGHPWRYLPENQTNIYKEKLKNLNTDEEIYKEPRNIEELKVEKGDEILENTYDEVRGKWMTSVGEIAYVDTGLLDIPLALLIGGESSSSLNLSKNGPPLRMIFDLFTSGAYRDNTTGNIFSYHDWVHQNFATNLPTNPRLGTWNINTQWVSLDASGKMLAQHPFQRGFDMWLNFIGGSMTNNTNISLKHFNSEAGANFSSMGDSLGTALLANQISTAANAFTIHVVSQTLQEIAGKKIVTGEEWSQIVVAVEQDASATNSISGAPFQNRYRILSYRTKAMTP